jgi:glycosyltransferase involved in cell wall biosynthesis
MRFVFISERTFEPWDWTNPERQGIGGSETSHIVMAEGLATLGHSVLSFAPVPWSGEVRRGPAGVEWLPVEMLDVFLAGFDDRIKTVFVVYRAPRIADLLPAGAVAWLICQDQDYTRKDNALTVERAAKFTRIVALCEFHADNMRRGLPAAAGRVCVSSNGIKLDTIKALADGQSFGRFEPSGDGTYSRRHYTRNPHRLMYASSPDRGLEYLLKFFPRIRELVPDAELHVCYGFDNIEKVIARAAHPIVAQNRDRIVHMMDQPGVFHYGRLGQTEVLKNWFESAVWCHPSNFGETSCITCMDAQACGAIPVTRALWAIAENVDFGYFIEGDTREPLVQALYVRQVAELLLNPDIQERIREDMMPAARARFGWQRFISQWEVWASMNIENQQPVAREESSLERRYSSAERSV